MMTNKSKVFIRPVQKADSEAIGKIVRAVFEEFGAPKEGTVYSDPRTFKMFEEIAAANERSFPKKTAEYFVAECESEILGGCGFFPTEGLPAFCAEIVKFYLLPKARGMGLGSKLLFMAEEAAKNCGYKSAYIESLSHFEKAVSMYEKRGYKKCARLGNSGHAATTVLMLKKL